MHHLNSCFQSFQRIRVSDIMNESLCRESYWQKIMCLEVRSFILNVFFSRFSQLHMQNDQGLNERDLCSSARWCMHVRIHTQHSNVHQHNMLLHPGRSLNCPYGDSFQAALETHVKPLLRWIYIYMLTGEKQRDKLSVLSFHRGMEYCSRQYFQRPFNLLWWGGITALQWDRHAFPLALGLFTRLNCDFLQRFSFPFSAGDWWRNLQVHCPLSPWQGVDSFVVWLNNNFIMWLSWICNCTPSETFKMNFGGWHVWFLKRVVMDDWWIVF